MLVAAGNFRTAGGEPAYNIAAWNGNNWSTFGLGLTYGGVAALAEYGGDLYAGGLFLQAGEQPADSFAKWNGTEWALLARIQMRRYAR